MKKYVEIEEIMDNEFEPAQMIRFYVVDDAHAEQIYENYLDVIPNNKAKLVEMNHADDPKDNKPCKEFKIEDGKVKR